MTTMLGLDSGRRVAAGPVHYIGQAWLHVGLSDVEGNNQKICGRQASVIEALVSVPFSESVITIWDPDPPPLTGRDGRRRGSAVPSREPRQLLWVCEEGTMLRVQDGTVGVEGEKNNARHIPGHG